MCGIEIVSALPLPLPLLPLVNCTYGCMYKQASKKKIERKKIHKRTTKAAAEKNREGENEKKMLYRVFHSLILVALRWRVSVYLSFSQCVLIRFSVDCVMNSNCCCCCGCCPVHCHTVLFYSKVWWRVFAHFYDSMMVFSHLRCSSVCNELISQNFFPFFACMHLPISLLIQSTMVMTNCVLFDNECQCNYAQQKKKICSNLDE